MRHVNYKKICNYCGREFIAQKSSTRFCSHQCAQKAYKERRRKTDILNVEKDTERQKKLLQAEEFKEVMCVSLAAKYLGISRSTLYRYLRSGSIKCLQLSRKTLIRKGHLDALLDGSHPYIYIKRPESHLETPEPLMTIRDIAEKYDVCVAHASNIMANSGIEKIQDGKLLFYPQKKVESLFARRVRNRYQEISEWYTAKEIMEKYGKTPSAVYSFVSEHAIPSKNINRVKHYSKLHVDRLMKTGDDISPADYYTSEEAMQKFGLTREQVYWLVGKFHIRSVKIFKYAHYDKKSFDDAVENINHLANKKIEASFDNSLYYSIEQMMQKFSISKDSAYRFVSKWGISKYSHKGKGYYDRKEVDEAILHPERKPQKEKREPDKEKYCTIKQIMEKWNLTESRARSLVSEKKISKVTYKGFSYYVRKEVEEVLIKNRTISGET